LAEARDMAVSWTPYVWPHEVPLAPHTLRAAERRLGVTFPADYVACVLLNQGKTPDPSLFDFGDGFSTVLNQLYHFEASPSTANVLHAHEHLTTAGVPSEIVPFAGDPAGNHICFDFRGHAAMPTVVILDHEVEGEHAFVPVAAGFSDLLAKLR
jgi:cell wall assembly regulator SMI1